MLEGQIRHKFEEIGVSKYESLGRFFSKYQRPTTRKSYAVALASYFVWLRSAKSVTMTPDEMITDNLRCVFRSDPVDVATKRRHTDWLDGYVNGEMVKQEYSESQRKIVTAAVKKFYERNDSALFGDFEVARGKPHAPPAPLLSDEVRKVLKALPIAQRLPLMVVWQSAVEINRVLALTWGQVKETGEYPLRLELYGRKKHRRPYFTFIGRECTEHLRLWRETWTQLNGREPTPDDLVFIGKGGPMAPHWINGRLRVCALRLAKQGVIRNGSPRSWHSHALRASFKTEAEHAGIRSGMVEFWMGHNDGISWVYDHRDEVHRQDFADAYLKLEPFVSLESSRVSMEESFDEERKTWITEITELRREMASLRQSQQQRTTTALR